ncbi:MAG: tRNA (adenosine(37)-N6)-threonylcarbamoyltransferase complex transferase subunit TsaD [Micrococcales bacterium]|nr:tRNA (adenosine(37)-N6)-threonylcarbamoyltransferase complex transferase subunit TsaD [Micrococcales bacterium]
MPEPLILGIETSCDDTAVALSRGFNLLADQAASSMDQHAKFGGIVPEVASRAHLEVFQPVLQGALAQAGHQLTDIDAIGVTAGPGLVGSLAVGLAAAKALALALDAPLFGVNHVVAHALVDQMEHGPFLEAVLALVVSGGHTVLLIIDGRHITQLGATLDDAAGEAFDKVGRLLGLPYPAGPHIDLLARDGDPQAIAFPRALTRRQDLEKHPYDFSFSGLKTAAARWIEAHQNRGEAIDLADFSASYAEAAADVLVSKTIQAAKDHHLHTVVIGGGFAANSQLRAKATQKMAEAGLEVRIPRLGLCTDNGAMVAAATEHSFRHGQRPSQMSIGADSAMDLTQMVAEYPQVTRDGRLPSRPLGP